MVRLPAGIHLRRPGARIWSAVALAAIVASVILLARLLGSDAHSREQPPVAVAPSVTPSSTAGDDSVYNETDSVAPGAVRAAELFVRAWLQPTDGRSRERWYAGIARYASPDLAAQMRDVDPTINPATKITGHAVGIAVTDESVRVAVPTNAGTATVLCVRTAGEWRAATIDLGG